MHPDRQPWEQAWRDALYGPDGFYRHHAPSGHFTTSTQGVPAAGAVLALAVAELARRHGCDRVVDVGAGRGELLAELRRLDPGLHLAGVDVVGRPADLLVDAWHVSPGGAALPEGLEHLRNTLVVAHEWLDVVPCPVVGRNTRGVWRAVTVAPDGTEHPGGVVEGEALGWLETWVGADVRRAEVGLPRDLAAADLLGRLDSGVLLVVDYGHERGTRPADGTLTGFRSGRQVPPVPDGSCDLTAHVAVDSLVAHLRTVHPVDRCDVTDQRTALLHLLPDAADPRPVPHDLARRDPTAYLQALAQRAALGVLAAPGGLGSFRWVVTTRQ